MSSPAPAREVPPRLELECLKVLWSVPEASVKQIQEALRPRRALAYTTVMTVMDRLARRGCVERRKSGRSFLYAALLSRETVRHAAVRDLVDALFDGSETSLIDYVATGANGRPIQ